jgi:hypothetical protein
LTWYDLKQEANGIEEGARCGEYIEDRWVGEKPGKK